jgi:hypothetical protein
MKVFLKNEFVSVYYDASTDALWVKYISRVPDDKQFAVVADAMLDGFTKLKTSKFIADIRRMGILGLGSQELIITKLLPGMIKHLNGKTLHHAQLIDPKEIMGKVTANNVKNKSSHREGIEITQFFDEAEMIRYMNSIRS